MRTINGELQLQWKRLGGAERSAGEMREELLERCVSHLPFVGAIHMHRHVADTVAWARQQQGQKDITVFRLNLILQPKSRGLRIAPVTQQRRSLVPQARWACARITRLYVRSKRVVSHVDRNSSSRASGANRPEGLLAGLKRHPRRIAGV